MKFFKISLALQMLIATGLGLLVGIFFGDLCQVFAPYAGAYIMILKITAVPYLIGALIHGIGQLRASQATQILQKGLIFIAIAWSVNIAMIYLTYFVFPESKTAQLGGYIASSTASINFAELLIPDNIFYALSNNIIPAIVVFALLIGIALIHLKEKQVLMDSLQNLVEALTRITGWIARITPFGTFLIIANQAGTIQFSLIKQVSTYIISYILCISLIVFWIFPRIVHMLTHISSYRWFQMIFPVLILAYTTNVVIVCLPYIIELIRKEIAIIDPFDEKAQTQIQGTVSAVFNLPMGSLFITLFVFFLSIFYSNALPFSSQAQLFLTSFLSSLGAVGIGSWLNSLTFILDSLGMPLEAINLYLTTIPFTSGFQAMVSTIEIASLSLLITLACRKHIRLQWTKVAKEAFFTCLPVFLLFGLLKGFNPLPEIKNDKKSIFDLSISSGISVITDKTPPLPVETLPGEDTFDRILRTKVLRVGYVPHVAPYSFYNSNHHLVGYDIAFAYELAYDLGCSLELIPMTYADIIKNLKADLYDIGMSAVSINEKRLKHLAFTNPYQEPSFVFVTTAKNRRRFLSSISVKHHENLPIAVVKGTSYEALAKELFAKHPLILLDTYDDFEKTEQPCALFWEEAQAIAWSLHHRRFRVIFPNPPLGNDTLAYAIKPGNPRFLSYLNQWMNLKKIEGFTQKQYDLWVLGKTEIAAPQTPRWSVARHLGWVD